MMPEAMIVIPIFVIYRRLELVESLPALAQIDAAAAAGAADGISDKFG